MKIPIRSVPYRQVCSICKVEFLTSFRSKKICSKACRRTIKRVKKYRKCAVCGWDATIDVHHENGGEYALCPNHHSLITRGRLNLEEVLAGTIFKPMTNPMLSKFYQRLKESSIKEFKYIDIMSLFHWKRERTKKYVLRLVKLNKILYVQGGSGGKGKESIFTLQKG